MAILVMAVGTGVAITMFAFVNGVLWSSLDLGEERRFWHIEWTGKNKAVAPIGIHPLDYEVLKKESKSFDKLIGFRWNSQGVRNPSGDSHAINYVAALVETDFFDLIEEQPMLGRSFIAEDASSGQEDKIVISHSLWRDQFAASEDAIGASLLVGGKLRTVVGIMPPEFYFPDEVDVWIATNWTAFRENGRSGGLGRVWIVGVLADGVSAAQAKVELDTIGARLAQEYPDTNEGLVSVQIEPYVTWYAKGGGGDSFETVCYALLFCALLVLGVASANVFNLNIARTATRTAELSIRKAMGAKRAHIVSQVMLDGFILTSIGAIGGVLLAGWSLKLVWAKFVQQRWIPYWWHMDLDTRVILFVVFIVVVSVFASSLIPGLRASRSSVAENLKDDARTSSGLFIGALSKLVLGFQVVVTGVLAFVSVVMVIAWINMRVRDLPFDPERILTANIDLNAYFIGKNAEDRRQFVDAFKQRLEEYPGIERVAFSSQPGGGITVGVGGTRNRLIEVEGEVYRSEEEMLRARVNVVSNGFYEVFDVEPLIGRSLSNLDTFEGQKVCTVNKAFADYYWSDENPIGKRIRVIGVSGVPSEYRTVIGVMPNVTPQPKSGENLLERGFVKIMVPFSQVSGGWQNVIIKSSGDPLRSVEPMRQVMRELVPELVFGSRTLSLKSLIDQQFAARDLVFSMFGVFGAVSLVLGVVGLYAVMSFTTRQRFREFGIRMALGAHGGLIVKAVLTRGAILLIAAGVLGLGCGHVVSSALKSFAQVDQLELEMAYPIVIGILLLGTLISMGVPAWRASRISPTQALRVE